ncbi:MAG: DUF3540 domain-containing protein [Syntrophus sp. (in: bacteria)]
MKSVLLMKNLRPLTVNPDSESFAACRIIGKEEEDYIVLTDSSQLLRGTKADGCLLQPEISDLALVWQSSKDEVFILSILVKNSDSSQIVFKGDATIQTASGLMKIEGEAVEIAASQVVDVQAPEVNLKGRTGKVRFVDFSFLATTALLHLEKVSLIVEKMDSVLGRLTQRVKNSFRWVEQLDQTKAGHISHIAEERYSVRAGHANIIAKDDVKIDGSKIHLG